ncbi:MAG: hypothetical protein CMC99_04400 [Flavobacteriales bacterium]|nr:hypothetical protein [Flavobacteriales bacterium]
MNSETCSPYAQVMENVVGAPTKRLLTTTPMLYTTMVLVKDPLQAVRMNWLAIMMRLQARKTAVVNLRHAWVVQIRKH